jgi:glucan biosynthesis protein C
MRDASRCRWRFLRATSPRRTTPGPARFLGDRLVRLGVPLLAFFFMLHPLTVAIARTADGHPFWSGWWQMVVARAFGPGPLWFAEALLMVALGYAVWHAVRRGRETSAAKLATLPSTSAVGLGLMSFAVRLVLPVGKEVLWLQFGYFPCYIYLFVAGCAALGARLLERVTLRAPCRGWSFPPSRSFCCQS